MKASDELFHLIRSLTPSEKRYFKTNSKKESPDSNYLQLFDAIDKQKEYNEDALKKKHKGKKFVKYLSAEKGYLHDQIMKQMRAFHADRSIDNKINELLQDESFYRAKGLNDLRKKALDKARGLAEEYERFELQSEIIYRQITYTQEFSVKILDEPIRDLINHQNELHAVLTRFKKLWSLDQEIFALYRSGADFKDSGIISHLEKLKEGVEEEQDALSNSLRLNILFSTAMSVYSTCIGRDEDSFQYLLQLYEAYQSAPNAKREYLIHYRILLSNLVARAYDSRQDDMFRTFIDELKSLPSHSFNDEGEVFQNVYFLEHLRYLGQGRCEEAFALLPEIQRGLDTYGAKINTARRITFEYNIMIMFFVMHRFREANEWAENILNEKSEIKQGLTSVTRVLFPIIHFELGHHDLVENLTRSAYRYLLRQKRLHAFERLMVNYLQELPLSCDSKEFKKKLIGLSEQLSVLRRKKDPMIEGFEEVELWVRSKIEGVSMLDLLKKR